MDILQHLATIDDIKDELEKVKEEERSLNRQILFNLTGNQDFYDPQACTDVVKSSAVEYNRIASDLRAMGSSVKGNVLQFFIHSTGITEEIASICQEMDTCSGDALEASKNIKHYNTLKVSFAVFYKKCR